MLLSYIVLLILVIGLVLIVEIKNPHTTWAARPIKTNRQRRK